MSKGFLLLWIAGTVLAAQEPPQQPTAPQQAPPAPVLKERSDAPPPNSIQLDAGTHVLLSMMNSVSTKQSSVGDRIYLETAFPIFANGKLIVPRGSWVTGTITDVVKPKRGLKGNASLAVRFDSLTLPNGVSRNFGADLSAVDAATNGTVDKEHSKVKGPGGMSKEEARGVAIAAGSGAGVGSSVGAIMGHAAKGGLIGAAAGGGGALAVVLLSKRPDAILMRGTTVEMVLDRPVTYSLDELGGLSDGRPAR